MGIVTIAHMPPALLGPQRPDHAADRNIAVQDLPVHALSHPRDTVYAAERVLANSRDHGERSYAGQALGIASRQLGDVPAAVRHLRAALNDAAAVGQEREADVEASLGGTLAFAGRTAEALRHLDAAIQKVSGAPAARIRVRHGYLLQMIGRTVEAVEELRLAARVLRAVGDGVWEARALINLTQALIDRGDARRAEDTLTRAENLLRAAGQTYEAAAVRHNRGLAAALLGRVPEALAHYDAAEQMYADAGALPAELPEDRSAALLAAGLPSDALGFAQQAVDLLRRRGASPAYRANALVRAADAALAAGQPDLARGYAQEAVRLFRRQGRERGQTLARLDVVRARHAGGERSRRLFSDAAKVAAAAERYRVVEVIEAHLLAGQIALALGDRDAAEPHLLRSTRGRSNGSALGRVLGWHAAALRAQAAGRRRAVFAACEHGLSTLDAHQLTLGALETRAAATAHGAALASIAIEEAVRADDARLLLGWSERWRGTAFALPPVRPPDDSELAADLGLLRRVKRRLDAATADGSPTGALERECRRLEEEVRRRTLRASGPYTAMKRPDVDELLDGLGDHRLVEIVRVDDRLHVLVASKAGVLHRVAGSWQAALREVTFERFALRRLAYGIGRGQIRADSFRAAMQIIERGALERHILGAAADDLDDAPLVLVPPAALHAVPWGLLPALASRAFTVAPSATAWLRARATEEPEDRSVSLVAGPGLDGGGAEVTALVHRYPDAELLRDGMATAGNVLGSLEDRWLAHIAAHGTFRAGNPLFSSLAVDDGPLTVLDLQRLRRAPYRLVLTSCDSGTTAPAGSEELLGLVSALAPLGTAGLLAAVVPVNDEATVPFSLFIHDRLRAGATIAEALRDARTRAPEDPTAYATPRSFLAFGAV